MEINSTAAVSGLPSASESWSATADKSARNPEPVKARPFRSRSRWRVRRRPRERRSPKPPESDNTVANRDTNHFAHRFDVQLGEDIGVVAFRCANADVQVACQFLITAAS